MPTRNDKNLPLKQDRFITKDVGGDSMDDCELFMTLDANYFTVVDATTGVTKVFKRNGSQSHNPSLRESLERVNIQNRARYARKES
jgi:hypothetical protein